MQPRLIAIFTLLLCNSLVAHGQRVLTTEPTKKISGQHTPLMITAPNVPSAFDLFGEKMPLNIWDVKERFDRELLFNTYL